VADIGLYNHLEFKDGDECPDEDVWYNLLGDRDGWCGGTGMSDSKILTTLDVAGYNHSGFQFQQASSGLDRNQLAVQIVNSMAVDIEQGKPVLMTYYVNNESRHAIVITGYKINADGYIYLKGLWGGVISLF